MTTPHANPEDLDLYALGALDGEEKQALDAHLRDCPQCQQQLAAARQRTALIGLAAPPMAPRPQVKSALMDKVRAEKRAPITQTAPSKTGKKRWGLRFSFGFGLATAVLAFATYEFAKQDLDRGKQLQQLQAQLSEDAAALRPIRRRLPFCSNPTDLRDRAMCFTTRVWVWVSTPAKLRLRRPAKATNSGSFPRRARPSMPEWSTPIRRMEQ